MTDSFTDENEGDFLSATVALAERLGGEEYSEIIEAAAMHYAERNEIPRAIELAESIPDPYLKDRAFGPLAAACVDAGWKDIAGELIEAVEDPMLREQASEQVALKYARQGEFEDAVNLATELVDNGPVLGNIACIYAQKGLPAEGLALARSIENPTHRVATLSHLASEAFNNGKPVEAQDLLTEARAALDEIEFADERVLALVGIASVQQSLGDNEKAFESLSSAYKLCDQFDAPTAKDDALVQIVGALTQLKFFDTADKILEDVEDPFQFAHASIRMAKGYYQNGRDADGDHLLSQALEIGKEQSVYGEQGARIKDSLLVELAAAFATRHRFDDASQVAAMTSSSEDRRRALEEIGKVAELAKVDKVAAENADAIEEATSKAGYWLAISEVLKEPGHSESFERAISEAIKNAESIQLPYEQCLTHAEIAYRLTLAGKSDRANGFFTKSLNAIPKIEGNYRKAVCLLNLAARYHRVQKELTEQEHQVIRSIVVNLE